MILALLLLLADARDQKIASAMQSMIDRNEVPGAVTIVATPGGISHLGVTGFADPAKSKPLRKNSIFWIASMTKPTIGVSILMLEDEGKLSIDDLLSKHIPEFAGSKVTIRQMMTHTSGLAEATNDELAMATRLADLVPIYAAKKPLFEPGSQWRYCQSGINLLGRIIEVASGKPLPQFLDERLFKPLKMKDTTFYPTKKQAKRIVTTAALNEGKLTPGTISILHGKAPTDTNRYPAANGGLYSTGPDYARFARMLLRGGELDGKRYLSQAAFTKLTSNQTGTLNAGFIPGHAWGLTVGVVMEPQGQTAMSQPGTFGHGGAHGTQAWIDPKSGVALILMVQRSNFKNSDDSPVRAAFQQAATTP